MFLEHYSFNLESHIDLKADVLELQSIEGGTDESTNVKHFGSISNILNFNASVNNSITSSQN